ncbi:MAG: LicD family protein [Parachlamydiaceae bacterium]|nr:LicD family protein [Parachlamydiaceae bacterium]
MIIKDKFEGLSSFASQMGYVHLHLNENFKKSLKLLKETISTTPKSEKDLPKNDPLTVGLFYDLLMKIDRFLKKHKLPYWATCGTLLGVVRHHGMIPWDDDIDLAMFEEDVRRLLQLEETLVKINLGLAFHPKYEFYKIFPLDGELILRDNGEPYPWRFPFVDIFAMRDIQEKYTYTGQIWQEEGLKKDYFTDQELQFPLPELPFGPLYIPVPHSPINYVKRMYGPDWNEVAFASYSHRNEQFVKKIKIDLIDRSPPDYILPTH